MTDNSLLVSQLFTEKYHHKPDIIVHAPGRVNLIGDHTDYNDGLVLPAAINFGTNIAASARNDNIIRVYAHDCDKQMVEFSLENIQFDQEKMWVNYIAGTMKVIQQSYPYPLIMGADLVISGNLPQNAGLSSSASLEIAVLKTFSELYKLDMTGIKAALKAQEAENKFVGCNCGVMDQLIIAVGKQNNALMLDCRSLTLAYAPIPENYSIFIVNSNVKRSLVDSKYNERREECEKAAALFGKKALRDLTMRELDSKKDSLDPVLYRRARHVVSENSRVVSAFSALRNSDISTLSMLMKDSHLSMKNDFEITTREIDGLVEIIDNAIGERGGVRMTGGGFGGCVVALIPDELVESLSTLVEQQYLSDYGLTANIYICHASQGAFV